MNDQVVENDLESQIFEETDSGLKSSLCNVRYIVVFIFLLIVGFCSGYYLQDLLSMSPSSEPMQERNHDNVKLDLGGTEIRLENKNDDGKTAVHPNEIHPLPNTNTSISVSNNNTTYVNTTTTSVPQTKLQLTYENNSINITGLNEKEKQEELALLLLTVQNDTDLNNENLNLTFFTNSLYPFYNYINQKWTDLSQSISSYSKTFLISDTDINTSESIQSVDLTLTSTTKDASTNPDQTSSLVSAPAPDHSASDRNSSVLNSSTTKSASPGIFESIINFFTEPTPLRQQKDVIDKNENSRHRRVRRQPI